MTTNDIDEGYITKGTTVVHTCSCEDLDEQCTLLKQAIQKHSNVAFWYGLIAHTSRKHKHSDNDKDSESKQLSIMLKGRNETQTCRKFKTLLIN